jgi:sulfide:quinone oxidoreductase
VADPRWGADRMAVERRGAHRVPMGSDAAGMPSTENRARAWRSTRVAAPSAADVARCSVEPATLVVLGTGDSESARRTTAQTAAGIQSSVLAVSARGPVRARGAVADGDRCRRVVGAHAAGRSAAGMSCARPPTPSRPRVVIAGAGVAGLETLLALRALATDRLDVTLVAPERQFADRSMAGAQPFRPRRVRRLRLPDTAAELGARWRHGALAHVEHDRRRAVTTDGHELRYDMLVVAVGARAVQPWRADDVLTYSGGRNAPAYRLLLHDLSAGRVNSLGFVRPAGPCWPLPLYDLALMTAAHCRAQGRTDVELSLITPEEEPLAIFGSSASAAVRELLEQSRVTLHTSSYGLPGCPGWIDISPGERRLRVDRVVTQPRLTGPRLPGIPVGSDGFVHTDAHGRVADMDAVFAAGDATAFPVKHEALAAQQADAVAAVIAASVGADVDPQPFRPTMRGLLLTGGTPRYLQADISGAAGDDSTISEQALRSPPSKLGGRYLAGYLSRRLGSAADAISGS